MNNRTQGEAGPMKLVEALEILQKVPTVKARVFRVSLACSFNPIHLQTFLTARLRLSISDQWTETVPGLYGDLWGNLERLKAAHPDVGILLIEWGDLDPRLGLRSLGSGIPAVFEDVLMNAKAVASQFHGAVEELSRSVPLVISFPTLPLPPFYFSPGWQASTFGLELRACVANLMLEVAQIANVKVVNPQRLDFLSPLSERFDAKSELVSGFPYKVPHASHLAELLAQLVHPPQPKKGLITDLDDTLWDGILGEVGIDGVSWNLDNHTHMHGVYQSLLQSLSTSGILIGAASKNDPEIVRGALERADLVLSQQAIFPVEAHWGPKSESVRRILETWNIGADSIVFIDDSPIELAEVKEAHPEIECILFPKNDYQAINDLLYRLRDLFEKKSISEEDAIRQGSLRRAYLNKGQNGLHSGLPENFMAQAEAAITLNFSKNPLDARALELVNKTNQFNLNGRRHTEASWQNDLKQSDTLMMLASYRDKYGPLGKIAVMVGRKKQDTILLDVWTMSCRAFGRRIEYRCIEELFERYHAKEIVLDFEPTPKNAPMRDFLKEILGSDPTPKCRLLREQLLKYRPNAFHRILEAPVG